MTTQPKQTAAQRKERNELAKAFAVQIAGSQIMFEVLDRTDGKFTSQVNRIAFELADDFMRRAAA
jgi:hypothetical protein